MKTLRLTSLFGIVLAIATMTILMIAAPPPAWGEDGKNCDADVEEEGNWGNDWSWVYKDGGDWHYGVPTADDNAAIATPSSEYNLTMNVTGPAVVSSLYIGHSLSGRSGSGETSYGSGLAVLDVTTGGSLAASYIYVGDENAGMVDQYGGLVTVENDLVISHGIHELGAEFSSYQLSGTGELSVSGTEIIGAAEYGVFTQAGGTNTALVIRITSGQYSQIDGTTVVTDLALDNGTYTLTGGELSATSLINETGTGTLNMNGGTLTLGGNTIDVDIFNVNSTTYTLESGKALVAGSIGGTGGTLTLNGGKLIVSGAINGPTLSFTSGTITGDTTFHSPFTVGTGVTQSPGSSPGVQTVDGVTETWGGGGTFLFQVLHTAGSTPGSDWDELVLTNGGILNITANSGNKFNINIEGLVSIGPDVKGTPLDFVSTNNYSWLMVDGPTIQGFDESAFNLAFTSGSFPGADIGKFSLAYETNNIYVKYTGGSGPLSVPEPATVVSILSGLLLLSFRRVFRMGETKRMVRGKGR